MKDKVVQIVAVKVGDLDILLNEIAGKTADLAAIPGQEAQKEFQKEYDKQVQLTALETLKTRRVTEQQLVEKDKTGRLKLLVAEVAVLRHYEKAGKTVNGIFIPALAPTHPAMVRKAEVEAILASGLKEANKAVDDAIKQQIAYCKQMGYMGSPAPVRK